MNTSETETGSRRTETQEEMETLGSIKVFLKRQQSKIKALQTLLFLSLMEHTQTLVQRTLSEALLEAAVNKCQDEATRQWLRENSPLFFQLAEMFHFFKEKIEEEEKKNHSDEVDVIFVAHGSIGRPLIPARGLLPLDGITDVVLYSPWNCVTDARVTYGIATGKIRPQHRVFYRSKQDKRQDSDAKRRPSDLPNHWNSMRKAGGQKIPTITVSPLRPDDGVWDSYKSLAHKRPPDRNRIVIPFFASSETVPLPVVTLAPSLVLLSSRFKVTVHLDTCLGNRTAETGLDENHLRQQYACTMSETGMTVSDDVFAKTWTEFFKRLFL